MSYPFSSLSTVSLTKDMFPGSLTLKGRRRGCERGSEGEEAGCCPGLSSPLAAAQHCHDQRHGNNIKEAGSRGSPHPFSYNPGLKIPDKSPKWKWTSWCLKLELSPCLPAQPALTCFPRQRRMESGCGSAAARGCRCSTVVPELENWLERWKWWLQVRWLYDSDRRVFVRCSRDTSSCWRLYMKMQSRVEGWADAGGPAHSWNLTGMSCPLKVCFISICQNDIIKNVLDMQFDLKNNN